MWRRSGNPGQSSTGTTRRPCASAKPGSSANLVKRMMDRAGEHAEQTWMTAGSIRSMITISTATNPGVRDVRHGAAMQRPEALGRCPDEQAGDLGRGPPADGWSYSCREPGSCRHASRPDSSDDIFVAFAPRFSFAVFTRPPGHGGPSLSLDACRRPLLRSGIGRGPGRPRPLHRYSRCPTHRARSVWNRSRRGSAIDPHP